MTLPYGNRKLVYSYHPTQLSPYEALEGLNKGRKMMTYLLFVIFSGLLIALCVNKPDNITDNPMYQYFYYSGIQTGHKDMEPSFIYIAKISPTFQTLLFIYAFLSVGTHMLGILRNAPNVWLSMALYLSFTFVLHDMIQIRVAVAAGIMLMSLRYISERKWYYYFLLIGIAALFHFTILVFLPMYFLPKKRLVKWFWITVLGLALVFALFDLKFGALLRFIPIGLINMYVEAYLGSRFHVGSELGPMRVLQCLTLMVMIYNSDRLKVHYPFAIPCICLSVFSMLSYLLLGDFAVLQMRMGELLGVVNIFTYAMIPMLSKKNYYILYIIPLIFVAYSMQSSLRLLDIA